jgi:hypothetical protein
VFGSCFEEKDSKLGLKEKERRRDLNISCKSFEFLSK